MAKVLILGAGNVGSTIAFLLTHSTFQPVIYLYDKNEEKSKAQIEDLTDANFSCSIFPWKGEKTDIVINCTGSAVLLQTGDRDNELLIAKKNVDEIVRLLGDFDGLFINIANPCDKVTALFGKSLKTAKNRIFGTGTALDTVRLRKYVPDKSVYLIGEHGNNNILITDYKEAKLSLGAVRRTAWKIIKEKGCTNFGIANLVCGIIESILAGEEKRLTLCVCHEDGNWFSDVCTLTPSGIINVQTPYLKPKDKAKLKKIVKEINQ